MEFSAQQIADFLKGEVVGDPEVCVSNFSKIEEGTPGTLTFLANAKYTHYIYDTNASIVLVNRDFLPESEIKATLIKVDNAYACLANLLKLVESAKPQKHGKSSMAYIASSAKVEDDLYIGAFAYVGEQSVIGKNVKIYPQVYVGDHVKIGDNTILYPGVRIYDGCCVGNNCTIHAGAVLGADGFGFAPGPNGYEKIPQIGIVTIEDNVEIGANTTIDRATMGSTLVKQGVKLDNLIQVAHNVEIGENTVMAAQVGIAGSTKVGANCMMGGQVGIAGHIHIGDKSSLGAQTGVNTNVPAGSIYLGSPAMNAKDMAKSHVVYKRLPELYKTLNALQRQVEELKQSITKFHV